MRIAIGALQDVVAFLNERIGLGIAPHRSERQCEFAGHVGHPIALRGEFSENGLRLAQPLF
jgi:hypothetical protein